METNGYITTDGTEVTEYDGSLPLCVAIIGNMKEEQLVVSGNNVANVDQANRQVKEALNIALEEATKAAQDKRSLAGIHNDVAGKVASITEGEYADEHAKELAIMSASMDELNGNVQAYIAEQGGLVAFTKKHLEQELPEGVELKLAA